MMPGRVMFHSRCQRPAPSTTAASYSDASMFSSAARKMIVAQPVSFQMNCSVTSGLKKPGSVMTLTAGRPKSRRVWTKMPEPPSTCCQSETTITHEMKWGR